MRDKHRVIDSLVTKNLLSYILFLFLLCLIWVVVNVNEMSTTQSLCPIGPLNSLYQLTNPCSLGNYEKNKNKQKRIEHCHHFT